MKRSMYLTLPMDKTTVSPRDGPVAQAETEIEIEITSEMVEAGVRVARESGFLELESSADSLFVRNILQAALRRRKEGTKSSSTRSSAL